MKKPQKPIPAESVILSACINFKFPKLKLVPNFTLQSSARMQVSVEYPGPYPVRFIPAADVQPDKFGPNYELTEDGIRTHLDPWRADIIKWIRSQLLVLMDQQPARLAGCAVSEISIQVIPASGHLFCQVINFGSWQDHSPFVLGTVEHTASCHSG